MNKPVTKNKVISFSDLSERAEEFDMLARHRSVMKKRKMYISLAFCLMAFYVVGLVSFSFLAVPTITKAMFGL